MLRSFTLLLALAATTQLYGAGVHYQLDAKFNRDRGTLAAKVTITLPPGSTPPDFLLGAAYKVSSSAATNATIVVAPTANPWKGLQRITVTRRRADLPIRFTVRYGGELGPSGQPPLNAISSDRIELNLDSMWLPIAEGFDTKYTIDATLRGVPRTLVAVAQGNVSQSRDTVRVQRQTLDFDFPFVAVRRLRRLDAGGVELLTASPDSATAKVYQRHAPAALAFLEAWFGPMPYGPVRVVVVNRRISGYARRGLVVVTEALRGGETGSAKFIAHEFAHAWWAPVDPNTEHRWLQESVADYVALRYVETALGAEALEELVSAKREAAAKAKPLLGGGVRGEAELYSKGPLMLMDLERSIGRTTLDALLRALASKPPRETREFLTALGGIAGSEAAQRFEAAMRR